MKLRIIFLNLLLFYENYCLIFMYFIHLIYNPITTFFQISKIENKNEKL